MRFEDIYAFFENLPPTYLNAEQAVCYILSVLVKEESYGTELILRLEQECPIFRISDPVLYAALNFLEEEQFITSFWQKLPGRGRPRRMLRLCPEVVEQAQELAQLWTSFAQSAAQNRSGKTQA